MSSRSAVLSSPVVGVEIDRDDPISVLFVPAAQQHLPIQARLTELGLTVTCTSGLTDIGEQLDREPFTLAFVDLTDDRTALLAVRSIRAQHPDLWMTGLMDPGRPLAAAEALRAGLTDVLTWPLDEHDVAATVANARDRSRIEAEEESPGARPRGDVLITNSPSMRVMMDRVRAAATESGGVLLCGERGSGRELVARAIHARGDRANRPFVSVDCGGGTLHEIEQRLFGLVTDRRSTPAPERRANERLGAGSAVFKANGGTLLLRNIVDAPTRVQTKLAKLMRDGEAMMTEDRTVIDLDFRPIAAVDSGLDAAIADERVRSELYDRLAQIRIDVPPLRRRREDIPLLAISLVRELCERRRIPEKTCSRAALVMLTALPWP